MRFISKAWCQVGQLKSADLWKIEVSAYVYICYVQDIEQDSPWIVLHKPQIRALRNNPRIGGAIFELYPNKYAKHGLTTNPWMAWMLNPHIVPKRVCKVWIKADPFKMNQKKESRDMSIESRTDLDY